MDTLGVYKSHDGLTVQCGITTETLETHRGESDGRKKEEHYFEALRT